MLRMWQSLCALLLVFSQGCSLVSQNPSALDEFYYELQPIPEALVGHVELKKLTFEGRVDNVVLAQLEWSKDALNAGVLSLTGIPLMQATWQSQQGITNFSSISLEKKLFLRIMRDIQWIHWSIAELARGAKNGISFQDVATKNSIRREIRINKRLIVSINYGDTWISLENFVENYKLTIEQLNE